MSRCPLLVRDAELTDVPALRGLLTGSSARGFDDSDPTEAEAAVARISADPDQRLLVAVSEGEVIGTVQLIRAPLSPLHADNALHVAHLHVREDMQRHGVGRALMEATLSWAEEKGTMHVLAAAASGSRDANRFMARLGLAQVAIVRAATVQSLRAKLPVETPAAARVGSRSHRSVAQVLAQRRSQRRAQTRTPDTAC
ncbi:GNAT family N-acetyltransferase [Nocardioides mesophilus]|uniref:GNAT family N-acetyltransferase n=1 Tax=Nocardioides mesophilus TaxID=433659 RepID=A0A7G9RBR8_9ACTN|nr:GNAT family N-acetyltransferase [Nocardioides mesophilus]QNN53043.1 GNAT family N-acetyltransferase [Nocardioides mesophilus]